MNKSSAAIAVGTVFLIVYLFMDAIEAGFHWKLMMFVLSPFVVIAMAIMIVKHGTFKGTELAAHEEFGYEDKDKKNLGTWG